MEGFTRRIIHHKKTVVVLTIALALICALAATRVSVNYTMSDYLPEDAESTTAIDLMQEEFNEAIPNGRIMVRNVSPAEAVEYKERILAVEGVEKVMWLDDIVSLQVPVEAVPAEVAEPYYKDGNALFQVVITKGKEVPAVTGIYDIIGDDNAIDGEAATNAASQKSSFRESMNAIMVLTPIIIIILLLMSTSWIEPLLFLAAIGISVIVNMGSNIFLGEVSYITQSISPILQMAVSLDYAIFLLHCFEKQRKLIPDTDEAMVLAVKEALPSVAASAATTLFGFMALMFMRFRIGSDLGMNLVKGIIFSYLSVMIFLPAVTLLCCNIFDKTKHRKWLPSVKPGRLLLKFRIPVIILLLIIIVPCFKAQSRSDFIYGMGEANAAMRLGHDNREINSVFGRSTPVAILVPKGDIAKETALCDDLAEIDHTTSVVSYAETVGHTIPSGFPDKEITNNFYSENYARIILNSDTKDEGQEAFAYIKEVRDTVSEYYDESYTTGPSAVLYDMKQVVSNDTNKVNGIAIFAIALVLLLTFKSWSLLIPAILLFIIEAAIWINLSVPYFADMSLVYLGFLVINTVQLGATIDYAIFFTNNYMTNRKTLGKRESVLSVLDNNLGAIFTSALILASAGITLKLTSTNPIVADLGMLLGRGTILSFALVALALPGLLLIFDKPIGATTLHADFYKEGK